MVRTGLEYSFLPGASRGAIYLLVSQSLIAPLALGDDKPPASCSAFLQKSEKAAQQWELERRFSAFECH